MKESASYPIWFGRAWVFVHEHMKKNPEKHVSSAVLNAFAAKMVQHMFTDEDMVCQLAVISLWGTICDISVFWFNFKFTWVNNRLRSQLLYPTFTQQTHRRRGSKALQQ